MQQSFEFVETSQPEPLPPVWSRLDAEERGAVVAVLARLMAKALERKEQTDE